MTIKCVCVGGGGGVGLNEWTEFFYKTYYAHFGFLYDQLVIICSFFNEVPRKQSLAIMPALASEALRRQLSPERIRLDLESEIMRGPGSIPTGGNIFHWNFFYTVKPLLPILPPKF